MHVKQLYYQLYCMGAEHLHKASSDYHCGSNFATDQALKKK